MRLRFNQFPAGDFIVAETVGLAGDDFAFRFEAETPNEKMPFQNMVTKGSFSIGPYPDGSSIVMQQGHSGHLNTFRPAGDRTLTCLEDGSEYVCVRPKDGAPYVSQRFDLTAGQKVTFKQGSTVVIGKGTFAIDGTQRVAPMVLVASSRPVEVEAITDVASMEFWRK